MPTSAARVVGCIAPPPGLSWARALATPAGQARAVLDFQIVAARALGVTFDRVRIHRKTAQMRPEKAAAAPGSWHRDSYGSAFHVTGVLGERPTQFLLGEIPEDFLDPTRDMTPLEGRLRLWEPEVGEVLRVDLYTIHRRPRIGDGPRVFLIGAAV